MGRDDAEIPPLVSAAAWAQTPAEVHDAVLALVALIRALSARLPELEARRKQTARHTSTPPASDPPCAPAPPPRVPRGKPNGAPIGHPDPPRPRVPPAPGDETVVGHPRACPAGPTARSPELPAALPPMRRQGWARHRFGRS